MSVEAIPLFPPPIFEPQRLDVKRDLPDTRNWYYSSSGKASLYQILLSLEVSGEVALPSYSCASLLVPLKELSLIPRFFDIDPADLNPCCDSLLEILELYPKIKCVIFPSLYGFPANLLRAEEICRTKNVWLIDDAAQSFGSAIGDQKIGTFGDAGLFSFSPGKATAGHMGSFFWTSKSPVPLLHTTKHPIQHYLKWLLFKVQRLEAERWSWGRMLWLFFQRLFNKWEKRFPMWNDQIEAFEKPILGGILHALLNGKFQFRLNSFSQIKGLSQKWKSVRLVQNLRGESHPHKWVLVFESIEMCQSLKHDLLTHQIAFGEGYVLLSDSHSSNAVSLQNRIIELPFIKDQKKMTSLIDFVHERLIKGY